MSKYDAIVIGSGIGGLTAAALLAKVAGQRVLVLEKHWIAGGQTHEFSREDYSWDVGLHYVGGIERENLANQVLQLITRGKLEWNRLPYDFDHFLYPELGFRFPSDRGELMARLEELFPRERANLATFFDHIHDAGTGLSRHLMLGALPGLARTLGRRVSAQIGKLAGRTTKVVLDDHFKDPKLKAVLASQWGDFGVPPGQSAFGMQALLLQHYWKGAYYPRGGASDFAKTIIPVIKASGGEVLTKTEVTRILTEKGKAIGVRTRRLPKGDEVNEILAPVVISSVGVRNTVMRLCQVKKLDGLRRALSLLPPEGSAITLYLGLDKSPAEMGFTGENLWLFRGMNHDALLSQNEGLIDGRASHAFLSFPSMKKTGAKGHTAEVITSADFDAFARWATTSWKRRGDDYMGLKERITESLLSLVEERFPGFKAHISYQELSTPLTLRSFTSWPRGGFYGLPMVPERLALHELAPKTPIEGLFLAGSDICTPGITGSMMGGFMSAATVMGPRLTLKAKKQAEEMPNPIVHPWRRGA